MKKISSLNHSLGHTERGHSHAAFDNIEMFVEKFDGEGRDEWQKPDEVIKSLNLQDDSTIVEIGAGTGYFAVRIAQAIKNSKVLCFDKSNNMVLHIINRASKLGIKNVHARTTKSDGSFKLNEEVNLIFSVDVYHHLQGRIAYFSNIKQYLKPDGELAVIDRMGEEIKGQPRGHRVPKKQVIEEMKEAGFTLVREFDFLLPVQYFLIFKRN